MCCFNPSFSLYSIFVGLIIIVMCFSSSFKEQNMKKNMTRIRQKMREKWKFCVACHLKWILHASCMPLCCHSNIICAVHVLPILKFMKWIVHAFIFSDQSFPDLLLLIVVFFSSLRFFLLSARLSSSSSFTVSFTNAAVRQLFRASTFQNHPDTIFIPSQQLLNKKWKKKIDCFDVVIVSFILSCDALILHRKNHNFFLFINRSIVHSIEHWL